MRIVSIFMALVVALILYVVIIEREALTTWISAQQPVSEEDSAAAPAVEADAARALIGAETSTPGSPPCTPDTSTEA